MISNGIMRKIVDMAVHFQNAMRIFRFSLVLYLYRLNLDENKPMIYFFRPRDWEQIHAPFPKSWSSQDFNSDLNKAHWWKLLEANEESLCVGKMRHQYDATHSPVLSSISHSANFIFGSRGIIYSGRNDAAKALCMFIIQIIFMFFTSSQKRRAKCLCLGEE